MNKYAKKFNSPIVVPALLQTGACNLIGALPPDEDKDKKSKRAKKSNR